MANGQTIGNPSTSSGGTLRLPLPPGGYLKSVVRGLRWGSKVVVVLCVMLCASVSAAPAHTGDTYALIVGGISKDPDDRAARDAAINNLRAHLLKDAHIDPRRLTVLAGDTGQSPPASGLQPTASNISEAIDRFASVIRPGDRFVFHYIGQANAVAGPPSGSESGGKLRFNLPGPDMTQNDLADRLGRIKASEQLIVLDCPCAALAAKALAGGNRIIVCASKAEQSYGTRFTPHFVQALAKPQTDADGDGSISVLEAFTTAARGIEQWYRQMQVLPTETPCLEDDGDGTPGEQPWKHRAEGGDGAKAATFFLTEGR